MPRSTLFTPETDERFEIAWKPYPRKTDKAGARAEFRKIDPDDKLLGKMLAEIARQKEQRSWKERDGSGVLRYVPHMRTWLHQRRWTDEPDEPATGGMTPTEAAERTRSANLKHVLDAGLPFILGNSH